MELVRLAVLIGLVRLAVLTGLVRLTVLTGLMMVVRRPIPVKLVGSTGRLGSRVLPKPLVPTVPGPPLTP